MGMSPSCHCICPGTGGGGSGSGSGGSGSGGGGRTPYGVDQRCIQCADATASLWYRVDVTASGGTCVALYNRSFYIEYSTFYGTNKCYWTSMSSGDYLNNHRLAGCTQQNTGLGRVELFMRHPAGAGLFADTEYSWYIWVLWATSGINSFVLGDYEFSNGASKIDCLASRTLTLVSGGSDAAAHGGTLTLGGTCTLTAV